MPGFDRTGPMGQGSQTGRKMGKCTSENETQVEDLPRGQGFRRGLGRRLRLGNGWDSQGPGRNFRRSGRRGNR